MVNTFNSILNKSSNNIALQNSEIEYLKELLIKHPYFRLCKKIISENKANYIERGTEILPITEKTDNKIDITLKDPKLQQSKQREIVQKYLDNPFSFYDLLK